MAKVYLVRNGIKDVGFVKSKNGTVDKNSNFYLITYNFKSNERYIDKKSYENWRLYTQIGQSLNTSRYYHFRTLEECVRKLEELNGDKILILESENLESKIEE